LLLARVQHNMGIVEQGTLQKVVK